MRATVPYVPTPHKIVRRMLKIARVGPGDVVYDLGCGDGRILIMAVKEFGAGRAVGYEMRGGCVRSRPVRDQAPKTSRQG